MRIRAAIQAAFLFPVLVATAPASSWLMGQEDTPSRESPRATFLGLQEVPADLLPYQHPFGESALQRANAARVREAVPGGAYLLRTAPFAKPGKAAQAEVRGLLAKAKELGFRLFGPLPQPVVANVPLLAMAVYEGDKPAAIPAELTAVRVEDARVHLCLLGLGTDAKGRDSREAPLFISAPLKPELAIRRAAAIQQFAKQTWGTPGTQAITRKDLALMWPEAVKNLEGFGAEADHMLLALRVIWRSDETHIPGPGGVLLKAVDGRVAHFRLQKLYTPPPVK